MLVGGAQERGFLTMVEEDLTKLSEQEEQVLRLLFGIGEALHSREEVGCRLGMSRGWLRQVERRALRNLRQVAIGRDAATEAQADRRERLMAGVALRRN
jgi:DNA-directed RNA polymerase sigma subunit (sigma70/sigma32)